MTERGILCLLTLDITEETMGENPLEEPQSSLRGCQAAPGPHAALGFSQTRLLQQSSSFIHSKMLMMGQFSPITHFFLLTSYVFSYVSLDYYRTRWLLVFKAEIKDAYNTIQQCVFLEIMTQVLKINNTSIFTLMFTSHHEKKPLAPEQMCVPAWKLLTRRIFLRNQVMISGNRHSYWVFQTFGRVITTSEVICGSIKLERRHVSLQQRPPKLSSSHQNHLLQRDTSQFRLGGNLNVFSFPC